MIDETGAGKLLDASLLHTDCRLLTRACASQAKFTERVAGGMNRQQAFLALGRQHR